MPLSVLSTGAVRVIHNMRMLAAGQGAVTDKDYGAAVACMTTMGESIGPVGINSDVQAWAQMWIEFVVAAQESPNALQKTIGKEVNHQATMFDADRKLKEKKQAAALLEAMVASDLGIAGIVVSQSHVQQRCCDLGCQAQVH